MKKYIGSTAKGFKFDNSDIGYGLSMDDYIDQEGMIVDYDKHINAFDIEFPNGQSWQYPADEVVAQILDNEPVADLKELFSKIKQL